MNPTAANPDADDPPFWQATRLRAESVLFVRPDAGGDAVAHLLFTPTAPPQLTSATGQRLYECGADYFWTPGTRILSVPESSPVSALREAELYPPRGSQKHGTCRDRVADLLFGEGAFFHNLQSAVTYDHALDGWQTPPTLLEPVRWPQLAARLRAARPLRLVLLGDSISVGHNASALYDAPPGTPGYGSLLGARLERDLGAPVELVNLSVSGMGSQWGVGQMDAVLDARPDLLVLAFGMNDASAQVPPEEFLANIQRMIDALGARRPDARCLAVASMTGHPQWTGTHLAAYPRYRDALLALRHRQVAVGDVTSVWQWVVGRKKDVDLTGNGLNHPNDFGHRLYAQVLYATLRQTLCP